MAAIQLELLRLYPYGEAHSGKTQSIFGRRFSSPPELGVRGLWRRALLGERWAGEIHPVFLKECIYIVDRSSHHEIKSLLRVARREHLEMNQGGRCSDIPECVDSACGDNGSRTCFAFERFSIHLELQASLDYVENFQLVPMRVPRRAGSWRNNFRENG